MNVPSAPERGPLYLLLLDLRNTWPGDQPFARQQLVKFLKEKPSGTRFAIFVLSDTLRLVQGFTEDKAQLVDAADPRKPKAHLPMVFLFGENYGMGDSLSTVGVFNRIAQYLDGLPGRKNLIWFSGSFPMQMFPSVDDPPDLQEEIKRAIDTLVEAQVAVYLVDVRGVLVWSKYLSGATTGSLQYGGLPSWNSAEFSEGIGQQRSTARLALTQFPGGSPMPGNPNFGSSLLFGYMAEDAIAEATGGRAFYSTNGLTDALADATEIGGNYYTITYSPTNENYDGKLRKIHVELSKKGYQVAYRRSYFADDLDSPELGKSTNMREVVQKSATRKTGDSLYANMQYGAPIAHQIYFRAHVHVVGAPSLATPEQMASLADEPVYFRIRQKDWATKPLPPVQVQTYVIDYALTTEPKQGSPMHSARPPALEFAVAAFDADGQMLNGLAEVSAPAGLDTTVTNPNGIVRAQQQIDVPLTAKSIRIAVREVSTDRIGAMDIPLPLAPETPSVLSRSANSGSTPNSTEPR